MGGREKIKYCQVDINDLSYTCRTCNGECNFLSRAKERLDKEGPFFQNEIRPIHALSKLAIQMQCFVLLVNVPATPVTAL